MRATGCASVSASTREHGPPERWIDADRATRKGHIDRLDRSWCDNREQPLSRSRSLKIQLAAQAVELLPERAVWWSARRTAIVADVHLGKDQVFRRSGVPIPAAVLDAELAALDAVVEATACERLLVLGDLVHAPPVEGEAWPGVVEVWRRRRSQLAVDLVLGNHDRGLTPWLRDWRIAARDDPYELDGLMFRHEMHDEDRPDAGMSGHLHPVAWLRSGRERLRLPAFARRGEHLLLPAFGRFTGGFDGLDRRGWQLFAAAGGRVVELTRRAAGSA